MANTLWTVLLFGAVLNMTDSAEAQALSLRVAPALTAEHSSGQQNIGPLQDIEQHDLQLGRRVHAYRFAGWTLFGAGTTLAFLSVPFINKSNDLVDTLYNPPLGRGLLISGAAFTISGLAFLVSARLLVGRRKRLRERERAYFQPELNVGVSPGGASLELTF